MPPVARCQDTSHERSGTRLNPNFTHLELEKLFGIRSFFGIQYAVVRCPRCFRKLTTRDWDRIV